MPLYEQLIFDSSKCQAAIERLQQTKKPVILFGAGIIGYYTVSFFKKIGIPIQCFCDNDVEKQKASYLGFPVIAFSDLCRCYPEACVIPTLANYTKVFDQISSSANSYEIIYLGTVDICDDTPTNEEFVKNHIRELENVYGLLEDDLSRSVLVNILNYKLTRNPDYAKSVKSQQAIYFEPDIIALDGNSVFLDVGAFNGDTVEEFIRYAGKNSIQERPYRKIFALEPDPENFQKLKERVLASKWQEIECLNYGAWDTVDTLSFFTGLDCGSTTSATNRDGAMKTTTIQTETIDRIVGESKVSFIKMDVEGAEMNALKGAASTIKRDRPLLAISVYHKKEDIFSIPQYLKHLVPDYRLYLRHYTDTAADTVLYAK